MARVSTSGESTVCAAAVLLRVSAKRSTTGEIQRSRYTGGYRRKCGLKRYNLLCARLAGHLCGRMQAQTGGLKRYSSLCARGECFLKEHCLCGCDLINRTNDANKAKKVDKVDWSV